MGLLIALMRGAPALAAGDRYVDPTGSDSGDCANVAAPCLTIAYAVAQATAGDTIHLAAGTYTGPGNQHVILSKALTLAGAGAATTILQYDPLTPWTLGGRLGILEIRVGDVTVTDLTIRDAPVEGGVALWGAQVWKSGGTVTNVTFDEVNFLNNAGRGLELHNDTTIVNLVVRDCLFEDNAGHGIRSASTTRISGFTITDTTFRNNGQSGYTQSAGSASYLSGLHVDGGTFEGNATYALRVGNVYDAVIEHSTFSGGGLGIGFITAAAGADPIGQVIIRNNVLTDLGGAAILVDITNTALDAPLTIESNTVNQTVGLLSMAGAAFDVGLAAGQTHATVAIDDNAITLAGTLGAATAAHALKLSGGLSDVTVTDNQLDGGNVGNNGGAPATSGLYLASNSTKFGAIAAADVVELATNTITGFVNGISVYDEAGGAFGGLPAANGLSIVRNSIAGNSDFGVRSGPANTAAAICNWWGSASGPGGVGPGSGDAVSSHVLFAPWLATSDLAGSLCGNVNDLFVGTNRGGQVGGVPFTDVDVLALDRDTGIWSKFFEGEDVNVSTNLTGFTFEPGGCLLISFDGNE
ncbi:MAG: right-handed parallel beta-helix repeat-containing protein, partial [Candidatus Promineofilum sp.]|nr:right-handed parallel beta-helix repeat-containing protein [Promineifilum sp.]